jgi:hypothetical protein
VSVTVGTAVGAPGGVGVMLGPGVGLSVLVGVSVGVEGADVAEGPGGPDEATLVSRGRRAGAVRHRINRRAARLQGVRLREAAVVLQRPEQRVSVVAVSWPGQAARIVAAEVVSLGR